MTTFKKPAPKAPAAPLAPVAKTNTTLAQPSKVTPDMAAVFAAVAGIENVDPSGDFKYFTPGFEGIVRIDAFLIKANPRKGKQFIMELVIETSNDENEFPVGEKMSFVQSLEKFDYGQKMLVQVVLATLGIDQNNREHREAMKEAQANMQQHVVSYSTEHDFEAEPLYAYLRTENKPKLDGGAFTLHVFSPVPPEMMEQSAE